LADRFCKDITENVTKTAKTQSHGEKVQSHGPNSTKLLSVRRDPVK